MKNIAFVEPDLTFIRDVRRYGGDNLKKCFQCATCSVVCKLSPDYQPFPRKEMLYASWGLKDRLVGNPDIWLCHNCGDCSIRCPRGAMPGETMAAIRRISIETYSRPSFMSPLIYNPKLMPVLFFLPALIILTVGFATGLLNMQHVGGQIVYARFFPVALIELIFIPLSILVGLVFFAGIRKMIRDMHANYARRGIGKSAAIKPVPFLQAVIKALPKIISHKDFGTCTEHRKRKLSHLMVSFSYVNLAIVAGLFVFALYVLDNHAPYPQLNPVKILANLSGVALIAGSLLLIKERLKTSSGTNSYYDWHLLGLSLFLGLTGLLTQLVRLAEWPGTAFVMYFIHLIFAFNLIAFLPYSKLAHFVYRTVAMAFRDYQKA